SGARIEVLQADVADAAQFSAALRRIESSLPPMRGIFHAAGIVDDGILLHQTAERFAKVAASKVSGAWNLHQLTRGLDLDFLVLFSSTAGLLGSPGQANYAAANAFLDVMAHHRNSAGLRTISIDWGPWTDSGLGARTDPSRWAKLGIGTIGNRQGALALGSVL